MPNKNLLLLSLEDAKIKKISNVMSNDSCRKILDYLSKKDATESELAERLQIPISTIHYNLQQLMETGLIESKEFHYSEKGKEVSHYKLANKYIIIAPKKTFGIKEKLKNILPVLLIVSGAAAIIQLISNHALSKGVMQSADLIVAKSAIAENAAKAVPVALSQTDKATNVAYFLPQNLTLWFLIGAIFALVVYFFIGLLRKNID